MKTLSSRQLEIIGAVWKLQQQTVVVTVPDLVAHLGLAGESSLIESLASIERKGYLTIVRMGRGQSRLVELTSLGLSAVPGGLLAQGLPVLGTIPAGSLTEAMQQVDEYVNPGDALPWKPGDFLLQVKGDSMIGDGILNGDRVLLRPNLSVNKGQIAAVQVRQDNGIYDGTLKHVHFQPGRKTVSLRASNPIYDDIVVPARRVEIVGGYKGLLRIV